MRRPLRSAKRESASSPRQRAVRPVLEGLEERMLLFATNGGEWFYNSRITFSIVPDGTSIGGVPSNLYSTMNRVTTTANWQAAISKAAVYWSSYANINMAQVSDNGASMGTTGNQQGDSRFGDIRISMIPMSGNVLGYAMLPPPYNGGTDAGDIVLNSNIAWQVNSDYDFQTVVIHELGHALGLDHSSLSTADMYPYYNGVKQTLTTDDIAGIQNVYGAYPAPNHSNVSWDTSTNLNPLLDSNAQIALSGLNVSGTQDSSYFKVVVPSNTTGTMTVSMQATNLSMVAPKVAVYNAAKSLVAFTSLANNYGSTATVVINGVAPGQTYYFRTNAASGMGAYGAYGLLVNFGSKAQAPIAPPYTVVAQQSSYSSTSMAITVSPDVELNPVAPVLKDLGGFTRLWPSSPGQSDHEDHDHSEPTQVNLGSHSAWGDGLLATGIPSTVRRYALTGPLGAGASSDEATTTVVNLRPSKAGRGLFPTPAKALPQLIAPWTGTDDPAHGTATAQAGAGTQSFDRGLSRWSFRNRHRLGV